MQCKLFRLECRVSGTPKPKITWYKSGKILKHNPDYQIFYEPTGTCTLTITRCTEEDTTEFSCEARNRNGVDITTSKITVSGLKYFIGHVFIHYFIISLFKSEYFIYCLCHRHVLFLHNLFLGAPFVSTAIIIYHTLYISM